MAAAQILSNVSAKSGAAGVMGCNVMPLSYCCVFGDLEGEGKGFTHLDGALISITVSFVLYLQSTGFFFLEQIGR